jgi:hypothetical protein
MAFKNLRGILNMSRIKIESVVSHLDREFEAALEAAVLEVMPEAHFERRTLYRAFERALSRKCSTWESVPAHYIEK